MNALCKVPNVQNKIEIEKYWDIHGAALPLCRYSWRSLGGKLKQSVENKLIPRVTIRYKYNPKLAVTGNYTLQTRATTQSPPRRFIIRSCL